MYQLIEQLNGRHVLVVGDVMLDRFVYGRVVRISPEAPVPVLKYDSELEMLGGAANVARNIVSLGGRVTLVGRVGEDEAGTRLATLAREQGITPHLVRDPVIPTTVKTRFVSDNHQIMRLDVESPMEAGAALADSLQDEILAVLARADALMLSDYAKGTLEPGLVRRLIDEARRAAIPVIVDPKTRNPARYSGATIITPNASEAMLMTEIECTSDAASTEAGVRICAEGGIDAAIITRGQQGMSVVRAGGGGATHIPSRISEVYDVSGAGDTVVAVLSLASAAQLDLVVSAELANAAAGISVSKPGTAVVTTQELDEYLRQAHADEPKLAARERAADIVANWRKQGLKVGFTNGCFDLIHPGHVQLLRKARQACDRLVVALNSDASVRRLKGEMRPVQNENSRATVMASMEAVDLVVVFSEDTPRELIGLLKPDVLLKGADYALADVVGADVVQAYGGRVALVPLEVGHSTTSIISRANIKETAQF